MAVFGEFDMQCSGAASHVLEIDVPDNGLFAPKDCAFARSSQLLGDIRVRAIVSESAALFLVASDLPVLKLILQTDFTPSTNPFQYGKSPYFTSRHTDS